MHSQTFLSAFLSLLVIGCDYSVAEEVSHFDIAQTIRCIDSTNTTPAHKISLLSDLLLRYADRFDPSYDQDIELDERRRTLIRARGGTDNPTAYVSFTELQRWESTNDLQVAIWSIVEKLAQRRAEGAAPLTDDTYLPKPLPSQLRSALLFETAFCKITNGWSSSAKEAVDSMRTWLGVRKYFSTTSVGLLPLRIRYIRKILGIETIWDENCSELSAGACSIMERLRAEALQDLASDPLVFSNQVVCCRMAQAVSSNNQFAARAEQLVTRLQDKGEKDFVGPARVFENEHSSVFAEQFRFTARLLWGEISENAYLAVVRDGKAARRAFIREIAALAHVGMDEAREMDRFYEFKTCEALGKMDEYNARRRAEWERAHPPPKREKPKTTFEFGTYPVSPELRRELDRYGMTAGFFTARSAISTNRLAYLLFTPKGKKLPSKVPLLAYLPGNGEIGEDVTRQFRQRALFKLVTSEDFQRKRPCYLLAVSPPDGTTAIFGRMPDGSPTDLQAAIGELIRGVARTRKSPQVDEARIYATGFSFGGEAVYGLAFAMPDLFAAAIPVSTTALDPGMVPDAPPSNYYHLYNEGDIRDLARERARLEAFGDRVRARGGDFRAGTFPKEGHNAWDAAWREEAVWDWLFSKRKGTAPAGARKGAPVPRQLAATCTASRPGRDGKSGPERAADGLDGTAYISDAPMGRGDWFQIAFAEPTSGRFSIRTGLADGRGRLTRGQVESSSDGRFWTKCARFQKDAGECAFEIRAHIRFLRILPEEVPPRPLTIREISISK